MVRNRLFIIIAGIALALSGAGAFAIASAATMAANQNQIGEMVSFDPPAFPGTPRTGPYTADPTAPVELVTTDGGCTWTNVNPENLADNADVYGFVRSYTTALFGLEYSTNHGATFHYAGVGASTTCPSV